MAWIYLFSAAGLEIVMAAALRQSNGWADFPASVLAVASALGSIFLLAHALKYLPVGTAYALWTGTGAVGVTAIGILLFRESLSPWRLASIALVVTGLVALRLSETAS